MAKSAADRVLDLVSVLESAGRELQRFSTAVLLRVYPAALVYDREVQELMDLDSVPSVCGQLRLEESGLGLDDLGVSALRSNYSALQDGTAAAVVVAHVVRALAKGNARAVKFAEALARLYDRDYADDALPRPDTVKAPVVIHSVEPPQADSKPVTQCAEEPEKVKPRAAAKPKPQAVAAPKPQAVAAPKPQVRTRAARKKADNAGSAAAGGMESDYARVRFPGWKMRVKLAAVLNGAECWSTEERAFLTGVVSKYDGSPVADVSAMSPKIRADYLTNALTEYGETLAPVRTYIERASRAYAAQ